MKNYKCLTSVKLEQYWHHSEILSESQIKLVSNFIREHVGYCRPTLIKQITSEELKKHKDNNL
jgi:hypothetical protein